MIVFTDHPTIAPDCPPVALTLAQLRIFSAVAKHGSLRSVPLTPAAHELATMIASYARMIKPHD
ncbi:MAG TPA: hypothetical protein VKS80_04830 [Trinickia sp.]|nr:hypothetical protein [Trinickia sp.]